MTGVFERARHRRMSMVLVWLTAFLAAGIFGGICPAKSGTAVEPREIDVGLVWTGTRVGFGSLLTEAAVFIAYYDENRALVVARIDLSTGAVERSVLGSIFGGWDSHNETVIAIDSRGILHVAGNMHAVPLVYFHGTEPLSIRNMVRSKMTGLDEAQVSYPQFFSLKDGHLAFAYRSGVSGDGLWFINVLDGEKWHHVSSAIFTNCATPNRSCTGANTVSAYPSDFDHQSGEFFNLAIVWRATPDVETNYLLSYARTTDLFHWFTTTGKPVALPIAPQTAETIDRTGPDSGLVNNVRVESDRSGLPIVVYTKYGDDGKNGIFAAHPAESGGWLSRSVATSAKRTEVRGRGSLSLPHFAFVGPGATELSVSFPNEPARTVDFDPVSLTPVKKPSQHAEVPSIAYPEIRTKDLVDPIISGSVPRRIGPSRFDVTFRWATQGLNSDLPRKCSAAAPLACNPPPIMLKAYVYPHRQTAEQ